MLMPIIAMALVLNPGLILADEPTTALDVTVQAEILDLLRLARDEFGASVLIITRASGLFMVGSQFCAAPLRATRRRLSRPALDST